MAQFHQQQYLQVMMYQFILLSILSASIISIQKPSPGSYRGIHLDPPHYAGQLHRSWYIVISPVKANRTQVNSFILEVPITGLSYLQ